MTMPLILRISQYFGFVATEVSTFVLLYLIIIKGSKRLGTYKYVMLSYALFSVIYAVVEILTQPIMHLHGASMIIYADSFLKNYSSIARAFVCLYCVSFGMCISLLATHFFYRYLAICRPNDLRHFDGWKLLKMYVLPLFFSCIWFWIAYVPLEPSLLKSDYIRIAVKEVYDEDTFRLGYIGVIYYYPDRTGQTVIRWSDFISVFVICGIMGLFINLILFCGYKTYKKMKTVEISMSFKTKELNNQLFRTLIFQTLVPMLTMFTPVALLVILPMFSINIGTLANAPSLNAGIYPALDATIAIFMIRDFRGAVICCRRTKITTSTVTSGVRYSISPDL